MKTISLKMFLRLPLTFETIGCGIVSFPMEICPEMHVNEIHLPHNRHHKVSSLVKFHQETLNYTKCEVYENV